MSWALATAGIVVACCMAALALSLRARLALVADAEHELRGPATALLLAVGALRRDPAVRRHALPLEAELLRLRAGLDDLAAARHGRRAACRSTSVDVERLARSAIEPWRHGRLSVPGRGGRVEWAAGGARPRADPGRLAQALGNLVANAAEHGSGPVELRGRRTPEGLRVEVRSGPGRRERPPEARPAAPGRGRGLRIAARAARAAGGRLLLARDEDGGMVAALDLPVEPTAGA